MTMCSGRGWRVAAAWPWCWTNPGYKMPNDKVGEKCDSIKNFQTSGIIQEIVVFVFPTKFILHLILVFTVHNLQIKIEGGANTF